MVTSTGRDFRATLDAMAKLDIAEMEAMEDRIRPLLKEIFILGVKYAATMPLDDLIKVRREIAAGA